MKTPRRSRQLFGKAKTLDIFYGPAGVALQVNALGSMITPFFTSARVRDFESAVTSDTAAFGMFFRGMLERGIYLPPSQFEAWFISGAHTPRDIQRTVAAARAAMLRGPTAQRIRAPAKAPLDVRRRTCPAVLLVSAVFCVVCVFCGS